MDASPVGGGALLTQKSAGESKLVACASRSLSPVEQRYSQTEREALGITWELEHFRLYIIGRRVTVITDHRPLLQIFNDPTNRPTARIERWILRLLVYDYVVIYSPGQKNPAGYISRHPSAVPACTKQGCASEVSAFSAEAHIFVTAAAACEYIDGSPPAVTLDEHQTVRHPVMHNVVELIRLGRWSELDHDNDVYSDIALLRIYRRVSLELSVSGDGDLLLRGERVEYRHHWKTALYELPMRVT